jgi:hypothetical protein
MTTIQPLNHFITDLYSPNQTSLEILQENITSLERKSTLFSVLEKISYVALAAIMATAFAMSYNLIALGSVATVALFLSTPIFIIAPTEFVKRSHQYARLAETENRVALKLRDIQNWSIEQMNEFFRVAGLDVAQVNQEALRQVSPQEPLRALLPLMARFTAMKDEVDEIQKNRREDNARLEAGFARKEAADGRPIPIAEKQKLRFENECQHGANLELRAIPTALNAATVLQIIQNPMRPDLDITPLSLTIPGLGHSEPKNYAERMFAKTYDGSFTGFGRLNGEIVPLTDEHWLNPAVTRVLSGGERDTYFVFNDPARAPITHQQIVDLNIEPYLLRPMLYS